MNAIELFFFSTCLHYTTIQINIKINRKKKLNKTSYLGYIISLQLIYSSSLNSFTIKSTGNNPLGTVDSNASNEVLM